MENSLTNVILSGITSETKATQFNVLGGNNKVNFDACEIIKETDKAFLIQTEDNCGSYLNSYIVTFWIPKSIFYKNIVNNGSYGFDVTLPFFFHVGYNKVKRG